MSLLITVFFYACWFVIGFVLLRWIGQRYFHEPRRAATFAAAVTLAFAIGVAWPFSGPRSGPAAPAVQQPAATSGRDVGSACQSANISGTKASGNVDAVVELLGGAPQGLTKGFVADPAGTLSIVGWAADAAGPAQAVCLVVDGKINPQASATYGLSRPDVGAAFKRDVFIRTGFSLTLPMSDLSKGVHHVSVAAVTSTGGAVVISAPATFRVP